ncbi:MAG: phosphotransferase family protein [Bacteroidetes bacterium]|nr:phosphotransferase family protein [Bacteroidota bacterium]
MEKPWETDSAIPVRAENRFDQTALQAYLDKQVPSIDTIREIRQFPGGFSNLTFLLKTSHTDFVLRLPPKGANIKSAHNMEREYKILRAIQPHYTAIPAPVHYCADSSVIGAPFFIMERINGLILRGSNPPKGKLPWTKMAKALIKNLADLHQINLSPETVESLARPEGYIQRQTAGWTKRYFQAKTDDLEKMELLADWIQKHSPKGTKTALIHNDYKYDNLVFDPKDPARIIAVLDWEMATVGHPLMDLGTSLAYWAEAGDPKLLYPYNLSWMPGNPNREEVAQMYFSATGTEPKDLQFYYLFGLFKVGVIAQQIYARYKQGNSKDKRFEALLHIVKACANNGILALEKGRISRLYE